MFLQLVKYRLTRIIADLILKTLKLTRFDVQTMKQHLKSKLKFEKQEKMAIQLVV